MTKLSTFAVAAGLALSAALASGTASANMSGQVDPAYTQPGVTADWNNTVSIVTRGGVYAQPTVSAEQLTQGASDSAHLVFEGRILRIEG